MQKFAVLIWSVNYQLFNNTLQAGNLHFTKGMMKFAVVVCLFVSGMLYAQSSSTSEAQNWLSRLSLQTLLVLTENHKDIDKLGRESLHGQSFSKFTISSSLFESVLNLESATENAYVFRMRVSRNEILTELIKKFKGANKLEYYKINNARLLELEKILIDLMEKIYLFRRISAHGNNLTAIHPKTLENIATAFDRTIDISLETLAVFLVGEKGQSVSRAEIVNILKNFNDVLKLSLPTNSYSQLSEIELATSVTRHITGAYRWNRSSFQRIFSCRRYFTL